MTDGLGEAGQALWDEVSKDRELSVPHKTLLLNACRIADRLDEIDKEIPRRGLTDVNKQGTEIINPLIPEQRQQLAALSAILTRMGFKELPTAGEKVSVADRLAEQREKREKRAAGQ
ncbi:hypothetical protein A5747_13400 [Mycobacterium sp. IS-836]|uniref:hypothetical protein n=1 Tax=Mycobacterium sp. IS-836 TaxID=1834160 RepID=UPI00096F57B4|nr:hypothetical protein [Mycobacterium sp. IS-836]OMC55383.1 hypothetical protein A5747_13400 [Mycobacterium sp. IS-836]